MAAPDPEEVGNLIELLAGQGWLSPRQAAPVLGIHYHTILQWIKRGYVNVIKVGPRTRILSGELLRLRAQGSKDSETPYPTNTQLPLQTNEAYNDDDYY
jgi:excisionase family DNA binding protein